MTVREGYRLMANKIDESGRIIVRRSFIAFYLPAASTTMANDELAALHA